ncbi:hypothetical protein M0811_05287 [Anaeramoeba ignava]|uniref:Uncharacterized protein n=1 Tax=Anaeramoeba ignava TaxID=1746090 RepID=A0A9Q0LU99_ANAIG|nr:hypothetical protein M0811_05287 [Anaeramoeba ignava]
MFIRQQQRNLFLNDPSNQDSEIIYPLSQNQDTLDWRNIIYDSNKTSNNFFKEDQSFAPNSTNSTLLSKNKTQKNENFSSVNDQITKTETKLFSIEFR